MAEPVSKQQAAADALRQLVHRGSAAVKAALESEDPAVRRIAARRLLGGTTLDPDAAQQRKAAAAQALGDHYATSLGRGNPGWSPQTSNPSDYSQVADTITGATGIPVTHDPTGASF